jgi:hemoglobin-like flavoprotein
VQSKFDEVKYPSVFQQVLTTTQKLLTPAWQKKVKEAYDRKAYWSSATVTKYCEEKGKRD